jgi:hypothetical protein
MQEDRQKNGLKMEADFSLSLMILVMIAEVSSKEGPVL